MIRHGKILLIHCFPWIIFTLVLAALPGGAIADYISIKGTVVNVRQGPGTTHPVFFQAEQGDEYDLISTEGLWCRIRVRDGQEAWVFSKLVEIHQGSRSGMVPDERPSSETPDYGKGWAPVWRLTFLLSAAVAAVVGFWKRREILRFTGRKLKDISGYKRDQAFRYDNRKPSDDSWEL